MNDYDMERSYDNETFHFDSAKDLFVAGLPQPSVLQPGCLSQKYKGYCFEYQDEISDYAILFSVFTLSHLLGTINYLAINKNLVDLASKDVVKQGTVEQSNTCLSPYRCLHNGHCVPANNLRGFYCDCSATLGYTGDFCERYSNECNGGVNYYFSYNFHRVFYAGLSNILYMEGKSQFWFKALRCLAEFGKKWLVICLF